MIKSGIYKKLLIVIVSIILNFVLSYIATSLKICFIFMDSVGTILSAVVLGPIYGSLVGLFTNVILSLFMDYAKYTLYCCKCYNRFGSWFYS
ncbi:hypothetical protein [Brachyspira alvinipulli]|uniref:hypothetical protein n=1 Tax=Brachyspira alvinipulli TaxID=84379 RepID=UPI000688B06E|nr:hypothetical protein [Brachyspira alvinipulli]